MHKILVVILLSAFAGAVAHAEIWHGCALAPNGREAWVASIETTEVNQTFNRGVDWTEQPILTNHDFYDIFFLDSLNGWTCGTIAEVWHTTNGGNNWSWEGFGTSKYFTRIQFIDPTHGWAAAGAAIMGRWDEGNQTWQQIILPYPQFSADTTDFYGLSFTDTLNGWICAGRYPSGDTFIGGQGYIGRTTDGGFTWSLLLRDTTYDLFDIRFADTLTGWLVGGNDRTMTAHIAKTTDGGRTWQNSTTAAGGLLRAVDFSDARNGWTVGKFGTILHTSDGGGTWDPQSSGVDTTLFDVDFADSLNGVASGADVILFTSDGGQTWVRTSVGIAERPSRAAPLSQTATFAVPSLAVRLPITIAVSGPPLAVGGPGGAVSLRIYDSHGRRVRDLWTGRSGRERFNLNWDGRDSQGQPVSSGVYIMRLASGAGGTSSKILYLKE